MRSPKSSPSTYGQMGAWAPYYDLIMRIFTLGREDALRRVTVDLASTRAGEKVLEVGCGTGTLAIAAKRRVGISGVVHGIDAAPEMIAVARKKSARAGAAITFQVGSIDKLPYPDDEFDVAMCSFMIFHMPDDVRQRGIKDVFRVLKPNGRLLIVEMGRVDLPGLQQSMTEAGFVDTARGRQKFALLPPAILYLRGVARKD